MSRAENRVEITRTIQATARRHLAEVGPAALSLRAIARDVGMVSSAVYRYFPSRDELLTALIVEAYDELGDAVEQADAGVRRRTDLDKRFLAVCARDPRLGARQPARVRAALRLPRARLRRPGRRPSPRPAGSPAPSSGSPRSPRPPATRSAPPPARCRRRSARPSTASAPRSRPRSSDERMVRWLMAWSTVFGHISLELFGHMHRGILDYDAHFGQVTGQLVADLGLA